MQTFAITSLITLLAATVSAGPVGERTAPVATIAFSNDQTGAWVSKDFALDGTVVGLASLLGNSPLAKDGHIPASSASLNGGLAAKPYCTLTNYVTGQVFPALTDRKTFLKLGSDPNKADTVDLFNFNIICKVEGH